MGATPAQLEKQYDLNAAYQRDPVKLEERIVLDMHDPEKFKKYLGDENYYHDFLVYFQEEIAAKGWEAVLDEYVFCGDKRADDMLVRMFGGECPTLFPGFCSGTTCKYGCYTCRDSSPKTSIILKR